MTPDELRDAARKAAHHYRHAERELCDLLSLIDQCRLWKTWGYSSLAHYAEDELGLTHRKALELIRVNASLQSLPELNKAFRTEDVPFSKVREATRVATPGSDAQWARTVREKPYREVEREVFADRRAATITVKLEMSAEEYDRFERGVEAVRRRQGRRAGLGECLDLMATAYLTLESTEDGASRYPDRSAGAPFTQVIYRCEACEKAEIETRRGRVSVDTNTLAQAACDSTVIRDGKRVRRVVPRPLARAVWSRARGRCEQCGQRGWLHLHHRVPVEENGKHDADNLMLLCSSCHRAAHRGVPCADTGAPEETRETARMSDTASKGQSNAGRQATRRSRAHRETGRRERPAMLLAESRIPWGKPPIRETPYPRGYERHPGVGVDRASDLARA